MECCILRNVIPPLDPRFDQGCCRYPMMTICQDIRPLLSGAKRVCLVMPAARNHTDKAVKALDAAISRAKEAKKPFWSGRARAARQAEAREQ